MPKVIGYTPSWLSRPSPGAKIFSDPEPQSPVSPSKRSSYIQSTPVPATNFPKRITTSRGSEIFTVVGNKIRWADLSRVQNDWEEQAFSRTRRDTHEPYRTLVTPVYYQITKLVISPSGVFLAICTEHTIHIAVLPDSSRLSDNDYSPLKLKTYQLGPTTHVIPESPLASVLWHPLATSSSVTDCLVSVTTEAAVRLWEIDRSNHWSFERPALAVDLRKLADGVSSDQDFEPSGFGKTRGFSADAFDMEVSAACFGGQGSPDEDGWAAMTLWTAMSNGDVYALCPLLPSRWRPSATTIPALSISAVSQISTLDPQSVLQEDQEAAEQQYEWVQELDNEMPIINGSESDEVRLRPQNPSALPRLQGPFELADIDELEDGELTDILVIAARLDEESLLSGEDDFELESHGISFTTVCLSSTSGRIHITIELDGVSGQWLPKKGRSAFRVPTSACRDLIMLDKVEIAMDRHTTTSSWPVLTPDVRDAYTIYITTNSKILSVSMSDWASRIGIGIGDEDETDSGLQTRLAIACQNTICATQEIFATDAHGSIPTPVLSAPAQLNTIDLGHMLVSSLDGQACVVSLDQTSFGQSFNTSGYGNFKTSERNTGALVRALEQDLPDPVPTRAPYVPSNIFYQNQMRPCDELRQKVPATRRSAMTERPLRLSPACLDIMTLAHRTFSVQTSNIEKAAAELFSKCERLREELADQVKQMSELADRLQHVPSALDNNDDKKGSFETRLEAAQEKQKQLFHRYETLRRKSGRVGTSNQALSSKEQIWIEEVEALAQQVSTSAEAEEQSTHSMAERYQTVRSLTEELVVQSTEITKSMVSPMTPDKLQRSNSSASKRSTLSISSRVQREKVTEVMSMVEREGAIINAVMDRLAKLDVGQT